MDNYNLIILNFSSGTVQKYNIESIEEIEDIEEYIQTELNLKLSNIEFMYNSNGFIKESKK